MEQLSVNEGSGQSAGYILYETVITRGGVLNSDGHVKDRGQRYKEFLTLRILVENQGRLASGTSMNQERKGLTGNIYLNGSPLRKFRIYSLEMQNKFIQRKLPNIWKPSFLHTEGPAFFLALLRVGSHPKDTFMSLQIIVFEEFKSTLVIYFTNTSQLGKAKGFREKRPGDCLIFQSLKRDFSSQDFRSRFDWSHLTPRELQNRSWGIQTEERAGRNPYFTLEGREFLILGGSIHYFRVPRASWRDRLLKLRACGFNTVTTYVPWNLHEPERGTFDFSGNLDLDKAGADAVPLSLELVGSPSAHTPPGGQIRLLVSGGFALRDGRVCSPTEEQDPHPAGDLGLLRSCCRLLTELTLSLSLCAAHSTGFSRIDKGRRMFTDPHKACPAAPPGTGPKAPGHWTRGWTRDPAPPAEPATPHPSWLLQDPTSQLRTTNHSFVNAVNKYFDHLIPRVAPLQYRRGGPIIAVQVENEYGFFYKDKAYMPYLLQALQQRGIGGLLLTADNSEEVTRGHIKGVLASINVKEFKVDSFKHLYKLQVRLAGVTAVRPLPPVPSPTPTVVYPSLKLSHYLPLWEALPYLQRPVTSNVPINMENLPINNGNGQSFGFVLYEMTVCSGGRLRANAQDEAQVFLNETSLGILTDVHRDIDIPPITGWNHGCVFINGRNLGRYWNIGPQEALYLPGSWLQPGANEIVLFEKEKRGSGVFSTDVRSRADFSERGATEASLAPETVLRTQRTQTLLIPSGRTDAVEPDLAFQSPRG
ncbi:hypothetical protein MJT46_010459 [Ovis ammon polii x Ovis aries]|nr:hypothetical protein MJT46_010459 [Ovis ammon polii x Ovis aries]